jgi:hypothetical protein
MDLLERLARLATAAAVVRRVLLLAGPVARVLVARPLALEVAEVGRLFQVQL